VATNSLAVEFMPVGLAGGPQAYDICVDNITFTVDPAPTPTPSPTPSGSSAMLLDFDTVMAGDYQYDDGGGSSFAYALDTTDAYAGGQCLMLTVTTAGGVWGAGGGQMNPVGPVDGAGLATLRIRYKTDQQATMIVSLIEQNVPAVDPTNEQWTTTSQTLTGDNNWNTLLIPMSSFTAEGMFNGQCSPNCGSTGNNLIDTNAMFGVDLQFTTGNPLTGATIRIDEIEFIL
jgi:hypothetical protein